MCRIRHCQRLAFDPTPPEVFPHSVSMPQARPHRSHARSRLLLRHPAPRSHPLHGSLISAPAAPCMDADAPKDHRGSAGRSGWLVPMPPPLLAPLANTPALATGQPPLPRAPVPLRPPAHRQVVANAPAAHSPHRHHLPAPPAPTSFGPSTGFPAETPFSHSTPLAHAGSARPPARHWPPHPRQRGQ